MSRVIWKFEVDVFGYFDDARSIDVPEGAQILKVGEQAGAMVFWAVVDPQAPAVTRRFRVVGTGLHVPDQCDTYWGTVQFGNGLVLHLWEETA